MKTVLAFLIIFGTAAFVNSQIQETQNFGFSKNQKVQGSVGVVFNKSTTGVAPIMVFLKSQVNLASIKSIQDQSARAKKVYDVLRANAMETQANLTHILKSKDVNFKTYYIVNMIAVFDATPELVMELANHPDVDRIVGNPVLQLNTPEPFKTMTDEEPGEDTIQSNLVAVGADKAWLELKARGQGIVVAGQDTGVQWDHPALMKKYRGYSEKGTLHEYNWHDAISTPVNSQPNKCGYDIKVPCDDDQHGTHTMGTIIGDDGATNIIGMAPDAKWIACRNMDSGFGMPSSYIDCFEFFLAPYPQGTDKMTMGDTSQAPHVINNSWGCPPSEGCEGGEFIPVLNALKTAGIMVVVSAGNSGSACSTIQDGPAFNSLETLSVGAHNHRNNTIAYFSSRGPSTFDGFLGPDIVAPGVSIRSSIPGNGYDGSMWSGTSMAGPHVVGQVALMWSANPKLIGKIDETADIIRRTATGKTDATQNCGNVSGKVVPNNTYGYGLINAYKSVQEAVKFQ